MRKILIILLFITTGINVFAQNIDLENLRMQANEEKTKGNYKTALIHYKQILKIEDDDYDAKLSIARLYHLQKNYKSSIVYFMDIHVSDSTDVTALTGLGDCHTYLDNLGKASEYYKKAISYSPSHVPTYFELAKVYSWQGKLNKAINIFEETMKLNNTYSEAWQGIGKMLYWQDKPKSAIDYYKKALELSPDDESVIKEYKEICKGLKYQISGDFKILNESEDAYQINALIQNYQFKKRLSNNFQISAAYLLDYSDREFTNTTAGDTTRWFDNAAVKISKISKDHRIDLFGGYSKSDDKFSSYGINWKWKFYIKPFYISNSLSAKYSYYYYWNKIGHKEFSDQLSVRYHKFRLNLSYAHGIVDSVMIADVPNNRYEVDFNRFDSYSMSLSYKLLSKPDIEVTANYSYMDYEFKSSLYYSPFGRKLLGPSVSIYYLYKNVYFYGSFSYNIGSEFYYDIIDSSLIKTDLNVDNWSALTKVGYNLNTLSFSLSANKFYNSYYSSYIISLSTIIHL